MNGLTLQVCETCLGWTLLHFIWQGLLVFFLLAGLMGVLRNSSPNKRYLAGCFALALLAIVPVITFTSLVQKERLNVGTPLKLNVTLAEEKVTFVQSVENGQHKIVAHPVESKMTLAQQLEPYLPTLVVLWSVGVLALSLRLMVGWVRVNQLKGRGAVELEQAWHAKLAELGQRLGMSRPVRMVQSALVEVPTVIGWLRPVILLPVGCLMELTPGQLESILAHELAHIRRHDYAVNILQSVVETFLFYHPAVWWISRLVREERENCCDDLAVEVCGDRVGYARALATLEELRLTPGTLALAAGGAPLLQRIRRLAGKPSTNRIQYPQRSAWPVAGLVVVLTVGVLFLGLRGNKAQALDNPIPVAQRITNSEGVFTFVTVSGKAVLNGVILDTNAPEISSDTNGFSWRPSSKINNVRFKYVHYDATPLTTVMNDLNVAFRSHYPLQEPLHFYLNRNGHNDPLDALSPTAGGVTNSLASVKITLNPAISNVSMEDALKYIASHASIPITYYWQQRGDLLGDVVFKLSDTIETRTFHIDTNHFHKILEKMQNAKNLDSANGSNTLVHQELLGWMKTLGVDFSTNSPLNSGRAIAWNDRKGVLFVRATIKDLDLIEAELQKELTPSVDINIKVKFVEMDESLFSQLGLIQVTNVPAGVSTNARQPGFNYIGGDSKISRIPNGVTNSIVLQWNSILTPKGCKELLDKLEKHNGTEILNLPEVTIESGRQCQFQAVDLMTIVTNVQALHDTNNKPSFNYQTGTMPFGPVLDVIPYINQKGLIDMTVVSSLTEFLGYEKGPKVEMDGLSAEKPLPRYKLRQLTANSSLEDGSTMILGGVSVGSGDEKLAKPSSTFKNPPPTSKTTAKKTLLVFITPQFVYSDGTPVHPEAK
jgi:beta-lactamase regulating signal transducer with metallopeptidase domain